MPRTAAGPPSLAELLHARDTRGELLLIAHPYPETISALEDAIPRFPAAGIRLVRLADLVAARRTSPEDRQNRKQTP